jgi:hypothetical protein
VLTHWLPVRRERTCHLTPCASASQPAKCQSLLAHCVSPHENKSGAPTQKGEGVSQLPPHQKPSHFCPAPSTTFKERVLSHNPTPPFQVDFDEIVLLDRKQLLPFSTSFPTLSNSPRLREFVGLCGCVCVFALLASCRRAFLVCGARSRQTGGSPPTPCLEQTRRTVDAHSRVSRIVAFP